MPINPDALTEDMVHFSDEVTAECTALIVARCREAGYTLDVHTVPIVATVGLNIVQAIANSAAKDTPNMKAMIGWLAMKRIKKDLLT